MGTEQETKKVVNWHITQREQYNQYREGGSWYGQNKSESESYLMIYWWFRQRWDGEREKFAVPVFVNNFLKNTNIKKKNAWIGVISSLNWIKCNMNAK